MPKGLRSFDAHDADFFLELLPGPRDRDGLPDSIRFWKTRIEETDAGQHVLRGPDLRAVGLRQVVAGEGRAAAPPVRRRDRRLRRGDGRGDGDPAAERAAETLSGLARQPGSERDAGGTAARAGHSRGQEGADRPRPVRAVAARQEGGSRTPNWCKPCGSATAAGCSASSWCGTTSGWRSSRFMRELEIRLRRRPELARWSISSTWTTPEKCWRRLGGPSANCPKTPATRARTRRSFLNQAVSGLAQEGKVISRAAGPVCRDDEGQALDACHARRRSAAPRASASRSSKRRSVRPPPRPNTAITRRRPGRS